MKELSFVALNRLNDYQVLDEYSNTIHFGTASLLEERIRLLLRPKPRWMPMRLWKYLLSRMIAVYRESWDDLRQLQ